MHKDLSEILYQFQTPYYYYKMDLFEQVLETLKAEASKYNYHIHYALKANNQKRIVEEICKAGLGADCVSGGEVAFALENGFPAEKVFFAGVGKTDREIEFALQHDIFAFNVESLHELEVIKEIATRMSKKAGIMLRMNPDLDAQTHAHISTGREEHKFGIPEHEIPQAIKLIRSSESLIFRGLHVHIGSQILDMNVFKNLALRVNQIQDYFKAEKLWCEHINLGGGLGIDYAQPHQYPIADFASYFKIINDHLVVEEQQQVHFELGRSIVGPIGTLISKVLYLKEHGKHQFAIIDASMTDLIRPALYGAQHYIGKVGIPNVDADREYDIAGPVCESSDMFGRNVRLPELKRGDLIAIHTAGAYGQVMASQYNLRPTAQAIFSDDLEIEDYE
jgi:diaminopimelate decarboxylase